MAYREIQLCSFSFYQFFIPLVFTWQGFDEITDILLINVVDIQEGEL